MSPTAYLYRFGACIMVAAVAAAAADHAAPIEVAGRIVGGSEVDPAFKYPFLIGVARVGDTACCECGGSIIADLWVLTAAHCIESGIDYTVLVSGHSRTLVQGQTNSCTEVISVIQTVCHESYAGGGSLANDVCLLKLSKAPRCAGELAAQNQFAVLDTVGSGRDDAGTQMTLAGWGLLAEGLEETPDRLNDVNVGIVGFDECNAVYGGGLTPGAMVCAGASGKDACQGDSGGPLFVQEDSGVFVQVGVVSFGSGCAREGIPGVYASVAYYRSWILTRIRELPRPPAPPRPPPLPPASPGLCLNTCSFANDQACDDGGPGAAYAECSTGSDCFDCGPRLVDSPPPLVLASPSLSPPPPTPPSLPPSPTSPPGVGCDPLRTSAQCADTCTQLCSLCACRSCDACAAVTLEVVASGSVDDYTDTSDLRARLAAAADVPAGAVLVRVSAASVRISATISPVSGTTAAGIRARMRRAVGSAGAASATLGLAVEGTPTISVGGGSSGLPIGALVGIIAGGAVAGLLVFGLLIYCLVKKKRSAKKKPARAEDVKEGGDAPAAPAGV